MEGGSGLYKIFPCAAVGGPSYIEFLKAPFHHFRSSPLAALSRKTQSLTYARVQRLSVSADTSFIRTRSAA